MADPTFLKVEWGDSFIFSVPTGEIEYLVDDFGQPVLDSLEIN
jgi:hypothetical protein